MLEELGYYGHEAFVLLENESVECISVKKCVEDNNAPYIEQRSMVVLKTGLEADLPLKKIER